LKGDGRRKKLPQLSRHLAYPGIEFLPIHHRLWSWLKGRPPECVHLRNEYHWTATLLPDTLYLRGKRSIRREVNRPEVTLCRECLVRAASAELKGFDGRVVAFEPDPEVLTQYFFVGQAEFDAAGLAPAVAAAIGQRFLADGESCETCAAPAKWVWFSREDVHSLDEVDRIADAQGERLCSEHGARKLLAALGSISEVSLFYMNLPYGNSGAYVWI
jgi:hypothetical protein